MSTSDLRPRRLPTQTYLLGLVAAVGIPLLAFAAFLLLRYAATERARFERDGLQFARQVALVVDSELAGLVALLKGLAASSALARDDFAQFHAEASSLIGGRDEVIVLRDLGSRQFVNTQRPFGSDLPPAVAITPADRAAFAAGRPVVSGVYLSPISGEPRIAVAFPIRRSGATAYVLAVTVPTARVRDALLPAVPPGWIIGIGDRDGTYVTRSARHEDITGKPGVPDYLEKAVGRSGTFTSINFEGVVLVAAYYRSDFSGWLYGANIPQEVVEAPLRRSLRLLAALGTAALALSVLLAYWLGRRFTAAMRDLARRATALGVGQPVAPVMTGPREVIVVGEALAAAATAIDERTRELETVLSRVPVAVSFTYDRQARKVVRNRFAAELMRVAETSSGTFSPSITTYGHVRILKDGRQMQLGHMPLSRAIRGERIEDEEYTYAFADGTARTVLTSATTLRDEHGTIIGAIAASLDITERKRIEQQRQLLVNELNHRVKNMLATVQSIALHTLRGAASPEDGLKAFTDRLLALAKVHDVLTRESWGGADLAEIVTGMLGPYAGPDRFDASGPPVWLTPSLSLSLAIALHELTTNAAKYGALSVAGGVVTVTWEVTQQDGTPRLVLRWVERGGPRVGPPAREGFGSRLLRRSLSAETGGTVTLDFAPDGLVCVMETPIPQ